MRPAPSDATATRRGVQTAADVRRVLAIELESVTANPDLDPIRKAHVVVQLAREVLHAIELATLEARVAAVEATLKVRRVPPTNKKETKP